MSQSDSIPRDVPLLREVKKLGEMARRAEGFIAPELVKRLQDMASDIPARYCSVMNADRNLKLGIVGRVKAGKSSFLNALLFDGEEWLPKAATPMTAALTRITYTKDDPKIIVHYCLKSEWERMRRYGREAWENNLKQVEDEIAKRRKNPRKYRLQDTPEEIDRLRAELLLETWEAMPPDMRAARELTDMAGDTRWDALPGSFPDPKNTENKIMIVPINSSTPEELRGSIHDFVGAGGKYTPFVSYIELQICDPRLNGLEIVDTPGLDDPVTSRVFATDKFLGECDAALLLSSVSHFLGAGDAELLVKKMRNVPRACIIGTMMDAGVLEYSNRLAGFQDAYSNSRDTYCQQAKMFLSELERKEGAMPGGIRPEDEPEFVSSLFHGLAQKLKHGRELSELDRHTLKQFRERFQDFGTLMCSPEDYENMAAFDDVIKRVYEPVRKEKDEIIAAKIRDHVKNEAVSVAKTLQEILINLAAGKAELENGQIADLEKKRQQLDAAIKNSEQGLQNLFGRMADNARKSINAIINNLNKELCRQDDIDIETKIESGVHVYESWGGLTKDYVPYTENVKTASAVKNSNRIAAFIIRARDLTDNSFENIIPRERITQDVLDVLKEAFDLTGYAPPKSQIENFVRELVRKFNNPPVDFSVENRAREAFLGKFGDNVSEWELEKLRRALGDQLRAVNNEIASQLKDSRDNIVRELDVAGITFGNTLKEKMAEHYHNIQSQLGDRAANLKKYDELTDMATGLKNSFLQAAGM